MYLLTVWMLLIGLDADEPQARDKAQARLEALGPLGIPTAVVGVSTGSPEVKRRCRLACPLAQDICDESLAWLYLFPPVDWGWGVGSRPEVIARGVRACRLVGLLVPEEWHALELADRWSEYRKPEYSAYFFLTPQSRVWNDQRFRSVNREFRTYWGFKD